MILSSGSELLDQLTWSSAVIAATGWLKDHPKFNYLNVDTERLNRVFAWGLAALGGLHITWTWDASSGDFAVHGLILSNILSAALSSGIGMFRSIVMQQGMFELRSAAMAMKAAAGIVASIAPPQADPKVGV